MNRDKWKNHGGERRQREEWENRDDGGKKKDGSEDTQGRIVG